MQGNGSETRQTNRAQALREAAFPVSWRGYDRSEVDRFLGETAEWIEGLVHQGGDATIVQRQLSKVGEQTAEVLGVAEETARRMRTEAAEETERIRAAARDEVARVRAEADTYARAVRADAEGEAERARAELEEELRTERVQASAKVSKMLAEASRKAERILEEAVRRRTRLRAATEQLKRDRTQILDDAGALADELAKVVATHAEITKRVSDRPDTVEAAPDPAEGPGEQKPGDPGSLLDE
jgi:DivIVA domain-containing protein